MKLEKDKYYRMPFIMGQLFDKNNLPQLIYTKTESIVLQYESDTETIRSLLPECYKPAKDPLVTVIFNYFDGLEFMAGGQYKTATVQVAAVFEGKEDKVEGDYILIMFENDTWPIIGGREDLGVPKLYADISPIKIMDSQILRCEASLWGHMMFGIELEPLKLQNKIVRQVASKQISQRPWLCYKYIPSLDGPPDADYPTITQNDVRVDKLWMGKKGSIFFGSTDMEDIWSIQNIIDSLKKLKLNRIVQTLHIQGSAILRYDLSRRLK